MYRSRSVTRSYYYNSMWNEEWEARRTTFQSTAAGPNIILNAGRGYLLSNMNMIKSNFDISHILQYKWYQFFNWCFLYLVLTIYGSLGWDWPLHQMKWDLRKPILFWVDFLKLEIMLYTSDNCLRECKKLLYALVRSKCTL